VGLRDSVETTYRGAPPALPPQRRPPKTWGVSPQNGNPHRCTLIYLHGFCGDALEYLQSDSDFGLPWRLGTDYAPGLRAVLPSAPELRQPWGETVNAWYSYANRSGNQIGDLSTLVATRERLTQLLHTEVEKLGDGSSVYLGGMSQGCTVALDVYLREAPRLGLGGFVGSVGFFPSDKLGFDGADAALRRFVADDQAKRPLWLQCAVDDHIDVPWPLVRASLRRASGGRLPGLGVRKVQGRGHQIWEWEASFLNEFLRNHARDTYY